MVGSTFYHNIINRLYLLYNDLFAIDICSGS